MLQQKHNAIAYHYVQEQVAAGTILRVGKVTSEANLGDPLTKVLPLVRQRQLFMF